MEPLVIKFKRVGSIQVPTPRYQTDGAVGLDLVAAVDRAFNINGQTWEDIPTGIALEIPEGWHGAVRGRSGLAFHGGMSVLHGVGTIDWDYRGEVKVPLYNHGHTAFGVKPLDRIAQIVFIKSPQVELVEVDELTPTARGIKGLGSTGMNS